MTGCGECLAYMSLRQPVLLPAMAERRAETGESAAAITARYMAGVHARHVAGLPIMPEVAS